ncbi:MAG: gamma carbonic anhydrase family protein [Rhizobiaceae bacterium]|nr:gamma carbonic anhydrase family protein [Rhizobiaceae bacterium]MBL4732898.1 gamma carbonic anhydrase family protein [Rhizobiaceae bacterium]
MALFELDGKKPSLPDEFFWVAPNASVIGQVILGEDASIWFGTVIRGDNEPITVGAGSNIQENCTLHTDPGFPISIAEGVTIGHNAMVHGCTIGENSLIGMSATILNGAIIGKNCLIGAGALIPSGKVIPDNSMVVGMPGKVIRELTEQEIQGLQLSAKHYVANAKRFSKGLVAL